MRRLTRYGVIVAAGMLAAGCSAGSGSSSSSGTGTGTGTGTSGKTTTNSVLTISNENGAQWTCGFNPLNASDTLLSVGFMYEPLVYMNPLQQGKTTPMLASSWSWGAGNKSLTFTIRPGVKFSDGTPMTAADVAYTFNLEKKFPALDLTGVWSVLSSVTATSASTVTMNFSTVAVPYFYYIADQTPILPEHIWSKIANPTTDPIKDPVGTGPYLMSKCSPANITYTANPHYWQPGEPKVAKIQYPAYTSNNTANDDLANGNAQWGAQYIPGIQAFYSSKSPNYHYWFPPTVNVSVVPNLTNPLLSNVKVRQAISYAIDRGQVSSIGESSYEPPANQTGIVTPTFSGTLNNSALTSWGNSYDPAKAKALLASAGYHMAGGVMTNAAGQKLSFTVINIGDYSDWVASMQVIQQDLKAIGIQVTPQNLSNTDFDADLYYGKYQLAYYDQQTFGPSAYYELNNWLNSANTAPVGKVAASNYERYNNPATTALLNQYATTTSAAQQQTILNKVQQAMLNDVPIIPVVEAVDWYQYDTGAFTGWPTPGDPYAQPSAYAYPDNEQVLLHLAPK
jgi:peptide/nickel transport system substrate-binding protein